MNRQILVKEPVQVLVRVMASGQIQPTSFVWRDKTRYVASLGRQWEERVEGQTLRCFLIQSVDESTYELRWQPGDDSWTLHRAWLRDLAG